MALSSEGATALVGGWAAENDAGAAWVFARTGTTWNEQEKLTGGSEGNGKTKFGYSVALSADGDTALIGGPHASSTYGGGVAWVLTRSDSTSTFGFDETLTAPGGRGGRFGVGVALPAGGEAALVGAPGNGRGAGAAWSFAVPEPPPTGGGGEEGGGGSGGGGETEPTKTSGGGGGPEPEATGDSGGGGNGGTGGGNVTGSGAVLAFGPVTSPICGVSLLGRSIAVSSHGRAAALELIWKGAGGSVTCRGRLTLEVKVKAKGSKSGNMRSKTETIGTAGFSTAPGRTEVVTIELNAAGRALLTAGHGRLNASLVILRVSPGPAHAQSASVRLAQQKRRRS